MEINSIYINLNRGKLIIFLQASNRSKRFCKPQESPNDPSCSLIDYKFSTNTKRNFLIPKVLFCLLHCWLSGARVQVWEDT